MTSTTERRRAWVMRFSCPFCFAPEGSPCVYPDGKADDGDGHVGVSPSRSVHKGDSYCPGLHVNRFKRAAKAAIDMLITTDGVAFDEEGATEEAEVREAAPETRPHLAQRATVRRAA